MGTSHTKLNGATKPSVSLPKDKSTPLETESSAGKASSRSSSIKTRPNGHIHNSHSSSGTASSTNRHLAQYHSCIEFVLSILNIYEVNYKLQLQDILNLLRIPYSDGKVYKSMNGQHDDALFHSLYLTIYNIILLFKFNRVMKENTSFPNIHLIIKYINYELMKMNYPRVLKLISIQNDDELLLLELFNAMNWLILSYNPILIKHVMSRDYLNQNFMNGELPTIPPSSSSSSSPPLYSQQFQYCGDRSMNHSKDSNLHSLIHQLVMNINKIFMVMSQIYNKSIQSNLLNMECDSIGYTPFELNLLLLNDHSSQLYQLNTFIGSFNHLLQYYEMIINERMIRFEDSRMIPSNGDDGGSNSSSSSSNSSNNTSGHGNSSSSNNTSGHDHNTSDMINDASNSNSTSNERNESSSFENHTPSIPFLLNSLKSVEKDEEHLQVSYNSLSDTFTHALGKLPIHSKTSMR
ncbi:hypothetical protein C9374_007718 [Naegleria lovaniensis]|uniref:Uncharacterized protein n=1 Tax=Naegleria lovaniensis TaxID=51637 RepID=A0AA88GLE7_NAELO|nr:uncharacterized protein C9374_007718 [Naegleria lovaniensis]KAG2379080.1 hypothetical protein C9374_007718 [Naegleria lovaniensis]